MTELDALLWRGDLAAALRSALATLDQGDSVALRTRLVRAYAQLGRARDAEAAARPLTGDDEAVRVARAEVLLARGHPSRARATLLDPPLGIWGKLVRAEVTRASGAAAEAIVLAQEALVPGLELPVDGQVRLTLARCLASAGDLDAAEALVEAVLDGLSEMPDLFRARCLDTRAACARKSGDAHRAVVLHREALALYRAELPTDAPLVGGCRYSLAQALHRTGAFREALAEMHQALHLTERALGEDHIDVWITRFELGRLEVDAGEMLDGFPRMQGAYEEVRKRLGAQHPVVRAMDRVR